MSTRQYPSPYPPLPPSPSSPPPSGPYPPISAMQHQQWSMPTPQLYQQPSSTPRAPPFVSHNSEGTNDRAPSTSSSSLSPGYPSSHLRPTQSTSALVPSPLPTSDGRRQSGSVNGEGWAGPARGQGWSGPHAVEKKESREAEMEAAIRASMAEVELSNAQKASARAEEERQLALMMSYSAEQDHIRARRMAEEREAEERALCQVLLQSRRDKGKGRQHETDEERRQLELVMQLSLEEAAQRRGSGETSAEVFERLSRSGFVVDEAESDGRRRTPPRIESSTSSARVSHSVIGDHSSPSVSSPGPISLRPTHSSAPLDVHPDIAHPPPAYEYAPEASPGVEEYSRNVVLGPGRTLSQVPSIPFASTSAQRPSSPPLPPLPSSPSFRPPLSTRNSSYASQSSATGVSTFYSTAGAAAASSRPLIRPPYSTTTTTESVSGSTILVSSPSPVSASLETEDPFDEQFAAVDPLPGDFEQDGGAANGGGRMVHDLWELTHGSRRRPASIVSIDSVSISASTTEPFNERLLTPSTATFDPNRSSISLSPSTTSFEDRRSSPLWGGLVDTSSANAIADETVLSDVKFGFVPVARRAQHPPLEHQGAFPDVAQLSRMGGPEGDSQEYTSFAVEAGSWKTLLTYLMWHGNSHIEAAPRDLQSEKSGRGLQCAILVEFFRSFEDHSTKVRCRLDLLPPLHSYDPLSDEASLASHSSFDPGCPSITIRLPQPPFLPISLATLATTLSAAHTLSRQTKAAWHSSSSTRALQDLANAVDLFKTLNGEVVNEDAGEVEDQESGLLRRLKGRLRRRKKAPGIVKGGADGTGEGRPLEGNNRPLPEGAGMITPFLLESQ